ncbi:MAG: PKD domain-containing protein [Ferruginibacter sp.]
MKIICLFVGLFCFSQFVFAKHITGGEMLYETLGDGSTPGTRAYRITLRLFRDENCTGCAAMPVTVSFGIFNNNNNAQVGGYISSSLLNTEQVGLNALPSCITNPPNLVYFVGYYSFNIDLPINATGYTIAYQTCCRIDGIMNVGNSVGATYTTVIPGTNQIGPNAIDNSPSFSKGISVVCYLKPFTLDFSATDADGDSLVYYLCDAYDGGAARDASYSTPGRPPYNSLGYINGYSGGQPLGSQAFINPNTGIISGIAPDAGKYVVSVCVASYDRTTGVYKSTHRKDFIVTVAPCDFAGAQLDPVYTSCDGFTVNFQNRNNSPLNISFYWDFGDGSTSTATAPSHTYADTGVFTMKLVVNRGGACSDSTTSLVKVFPGYFPAFIDNSPTCKSVPVQFHDRTNATYGSVNYWRWDFGNTAFLNDTSRIKDPVYTYNQTGTYTVTLEVKSDKGCEAIITKQITILDKAPFNVFPKDTLICAIDTLQLKAVATTGGNVTWSPNYMINNVNSFTPLVSPDITTKYYVHYADSFGCNADDSINVRVVSQVSLQAMGDTIICKTDSITLRLTTDALYFTWTPVTGINNTTVFNPKVSPASTTTYHVVASIGKCIKTADIKVTPIPYPLANAGKDSSICFGKDGQLNATGGSIYVWTPSVYLDASNIPNPKVIQPQRSVRYIVMVKDVLGCPKPVYDTMFLEVVKINANAGPADTSVVLGQPLQLNATGGEFYFWTPSTWLNRSDISNPISLPQDNIKYTVIVSDANGCTGTDTIRVKLYKVDPNLYVPTAFSPGNDELNDVFRPIALGIKSLESFRVYNRWGQLVFATTEIGKGWDGKFGGQPQATGTFVWYAEATDYLGKKIAQKGTVVLIR